MNQIPSLKQAESYLLEAQDLNPGKWIAHSRQVGQAAKLIANQHPALDPEISLILGYLHDIGRRSGITDIRHTYDGYQFLIKEGFPDAARICITHSFPTKQVCEVIDRWDAPKKYLRYIQKFLNAIEFNEYDKLLQLCDALAMHNGFVLIEKRLVDAAMRRGINDFTIQRWQITFAIQAEFEEVMQESIYTILDGVEANTFASR